MGGLWFGDIESFAATRIRPSMRANLILTRRSLESVEADGDVVRIVGWCLAVDGGDGRSLEVTVSPRGAATIRDLVVTSSPDVGRAHPGIPHAEKCRFALVVDVKGAPRDGYVLRLRPVFTTGVGRAWHVGVNLKAPPGEYVTRVGGGAEVGLEFIDYFVDYADLGEQETVLDFGCGTGRMALPMARVLGPSSHYVGVDLDPELIAWCRSNIARDDRRFEFIQSHARNDMYNPTGSDAAVGQIPVGTASRTFSFATSVFTHLKEAQAILYLSEVARCTRSGGRVLLTAYLVDESRASVPSLEFVRVGPETWTTNPELPELATGFARDSFVEWARRAGLRLRHLLEGSWSDRTRDFSYQDIMVFDRL
jgi:SAM-dependent methyltransferase